MRACAATFVILVSRVIWRLLFKFVTGANSWVRAVFRCGTLLGNTTNLS